MSHRIQPVFGAHGSTRNVAGSGTMTMSPAPPMPATPKPPSALNTGNTLRCAVSLASKVTVMAQPLRKTDAISWAATILEALGEAGVTTRNTVLLTEYV